MLRNLFLLIFLLQLPLVYATLSLVWPLQSQLPRIARVDQAYTWTFISPFNSSNSNLSVVYNMTKGPSWITFQSSSYTVTGTPTASDIGNPSITLEASDGDDSTSDTVVICVTDWPSPQVNYTVQEQFYVGNPSLASVFSLSSDSALTLSSGEPALRIPPSWSFSVGFDSTTFSAASNETIFYASSPLPDWVSFNSNELTFDGVTPKWPLNSTTDVKIVLYASDQKDYSAVSQVFHLVVAAHELAQNSSLRPLNFTMGQKFNKSLDISDLNGIVIDGSPVDSLANFSGHIDVSSYSWLTSSNLSLSGTAPTSPMNFNLPFSLFSSFLNQTLSSNLTISVISSVFTSSDLPTLIAPPGSSVSLNIKQYLVDSKSDSDFNITVSAPDAPWLSYNSDTFTISGTAPAHPNISQFTVTISAKDIGSGEVSEAHLPVTFSAQSGSKAAQGSHLPSKTKTIVVSIVSSLLSVVLLFGALACCRAHYSGRRNRNGGMYVVDQRGEGYWREKGALDNPYEYRAGGLGITEKGARFEEVFLDHQSPPPATPFAPSPAVSMFPVRQVSKADFFERMKNSLGKKGRGKPAISNPIVISMNDAPPRSASELTRPPVISEQDPFEDSSVSSHSTELDIATEQATRRRDFAPPRSPRVPFVLQPGGLRREVSVDSYDHDLETGEIIHASSLSVKEGKARLVEFKQARTGQEAMTSYQRQVSQEGIVVGSSQNGASTPPNSRQAAVSVHASPSFRNGIHYVKSNSRGSAGDASNHHPVTHSPASGTSAIFYDTPNPPPKAATKGVRTRNGRVPTPLSVLAETGVTSHKDHGHAASMHVRANQPFSWAAPFPIPPSHPDLKALQSDGRKLPEWLKFEQLEGEFWGIWYPDQKPVTTRSGKGRKPVEEDMTVVVQAGGAEVGRFKVVLES